MIPVYQPYLPSGAIDHAFQALNDGWISSRGTFVQLLEELCSEMYFYEDATSICNGTCALNLVFHLLKTRGKKRIFIPDYTYVATYNAAATAGLDIVLVDVELSSWNMDFESIADNFDLDSSDIVCLVDIYGAICWSNEQITFLKEKGVTFVSDSAESFGNFGVAMAARAELIDFQVFSFYGNKTVTCGEGGMIMSSRNNGRALKSLRSHSQLTPGEYRHGQVAFNYRLNNISAAIGAKQISLLDEILSRKRMLFSFYDQLVESHLRSHVYKQSFDPRSNALNNIQWLYTLALSSDNSPNEVIDYSDISQYFLKHGIEVRPGFVPLSMQEYIFRKSPQFATAAGFHSPGTSVTYIPCSWQLRAISLPSYPDLNEDSASLLSIKKAFEGLGKSAGLSL